MTWYGPDGFPCTMGEKYAMEKAEREKTKQMAREFDDKLLDAIKARQEKLDKQLVRADDLSRDYIYRYYHGSFKVYWLQKLTEEIVETFREIAEELQENSRPLGRLNGQFESILKEGTGKEWELSHNQRWDAETRPIVEAFFHARYFLQMMCKYGRELEKAPQCLPSGWASVLYLYRAR